MAFKQLIKLKHFPRHSSSQSFSLFRAVCNQQTNSNKNELSLNNRRKFTTNCFYLGQKNQLSYVHGSPPISTPYNISTVGELLEKATIESPEKNAVIVAHQNVIKSYQQFNSDVDQLAKALHSIGCRRGDTVGIWAINCYEWLLTQFATAKLGVVMVNVNPGYKEKEIHGCINLVGLKTLITNQKFKSSNYYKTLENVSPGLFANANGYRVQSKEMPTLQNVIFLDETEDIVPSNVMRFSELFLKGQSDQKLSHLLTERERTYFDDVINIQFTSGTTGAPKGAMLTHFNIVQNAISISRRLYEGYFPSDQNSAIICAPNPLYHCFGCVVGVATSVYIQGTIVLPGPVFNPAMTLTAIDQYRCNYLYGTPTMWADMLSSMGVDKFNTSSLKQGVMSGAPCPSPLLKSCFEKLPSLTNILIPYGTTELSPVATLTSIHDDFKRQTETVGRPLDNVEIKIIDLQTGNITPQGVKGEVCVRSHGTFVGYYNQPDKTKEVIDQTFWYHTGDVGQLDQDGYLSITGRIKEMIIRGGENIYPREVEDFIFQHSSVEDAHLVGIPDERLGEELVAYIKLKPGQQLSDADLKSFLKERMSHFKVPKHICFVDDFPRTVTGKVRKVELKDMAKKRFCENLSN